MLLVRSPHLEFFLDLSKTKVAVCSEPALRPGEEDVLDAAVVVLLPLGDVLQVGVEDEAENLSLSCFRDLVLSRCDTTIKFIVKNSQISIILKYGVAGRL